MVGLPREKKRTRKFNRDGRKTKTNNFKKKKNENLMKIKENTI